MDHWSRSYISTPYEKLNCAELVEKVQSDVFNRCFKFPQTNGNVFTESRRIKQEFERYVVPEKAKILEDGDLVLMNAKFEMAHVGVLCIVRGKLHVLHSSKTLGCVCLHKISEIKNYGLFLRGVYKWQKLDTTKTL